MTKNLKQKLVSLFFSDIPDITPPDSITKSEVKSWGEKFNRNYATGNFRLKWFGKVITGNELNVRRERVAKHHFRC